MIILRHNCLRAGVEDLEDGYVDVVVCVVVEYVKLIITGQHINKLIPIIKAYL